MADKPSVRASNAGPFTVGLDEDLEYESSKSFDLGEIVAGPRNQKGYLKKLYGARNSMDFLYVQNGSSHKVHVELTSGHVTTVKSATSSNIEGPITRFTIWHEEDGVTIDASDIDIQVGNGSRSEEVNAGFSLAQVAEDIVPGFNR